VKPYRNLVFEKAWSGRSAGLWGTSAVGLFFGGLVGMVAPFFPMAAGMAAPAGSAILNSMSIFGAFGMAAGFSTGVAVGIAAGSTSGMAEEQEKRELEKMRALGVSLPALDAKVAEQTVEKPDTRSGWQKFKDGFDTYINFRVGAVMTAIGAVGGAVMAAAYIALGGLDTSGAGAAVPGMGLLLGDVAAKSAPAVYTYFAGVMGVCFGGLWTFNFPRITTQMQEFAGGLTGGSLLGTQWGPAPEKSVEPEIAATPEPACGCKHKKFASFQDMLAKRGQETTPDIQPGI